MTDRLTEFTEEVVDWALVCDWVWVSRKECGLWALTSKGRGSEQSLAWRLGEFLQVSSLLQPAFLRTEGALCIQHHVWHGVGNGLVCMLFKWCMLR